MKKNSKIFVDGESIASSLLRLAQLRREPVDSLALQALIRELDLQKCDLHRMLEVLAHKNSWPKVQWAAKPDASRLPCLIVTPQGQIGVVTARDSRGRWACQWWNSEGRAFVEEMLSVLPDQVRAIRLRMTAPFVASSSPSLQLVWKEITSHKAVLMDIMAGTIALSVLALMTSFYSMQVYDRVVPTQAMSTLWVLTIGVLASVLFETIGKFVRSAQIHALTDAVDQNLARSVYGRFLHVRLDQLPSSVGSTSSRLRSYEGIRSFLVNMSTQAMVDIPLAMLTLCVLASVGGWLALIPACFLVSGVLLGLLYRVKMDQLAKLSTPAQHQKLGLLVETIEGAETIKSGNGGWRMLSRWLDLTDESRQFEQGMRHITEVQQYVVATFQQVAYVALIAFGAMTVGQGEFTMGAMIACSILSGRILSPIASIPGLIMQWAQTKVAIQDLDRLWLLEMDHPNGTEPVVLDELQGSYDLAGVEVLYGSNPALRIPRLTIAAGEKIAVIGGVGSGKTTLLRILSGMYKSRNGRVRLDGIDIEQISKSSIASNIGFVPQDGRLFAGTLRDNLVLGITDPGDAVLLDVARKTGLFDAVILSHPKGLNREISEGGQGLSGGQRQLVHITRAFLIKPTVWLLDEPTASMDAPLESRVLSAIQTYIDESPESTLILVTHKPQLLSLVHRVIVIAAHQVMMDGPRDAVIQALSQPPVTPQNIAPSAQAANSDTLKAV